MGERFARSPDSVVAVFRRERPHRRRTHWANCPTSRYRPGALRRSRRTFRDVATPENSSGTCSVLPATRPLTGPPPSSVSQCPHSRTRQCHWPLAKSRPGGRVVPSRLPWPDQAWHVGSPLCVEAQSRGLEENVDPLCVRLSRFSVQAVIRSVDQSPTVSSAVKSGSTFSAFLAHCSRLFRTVFALCGAGRQHETLGDELPLTCRVGESVTISRSACVTLKPA